MLVDKCPGLCPLIAMIDKVSDIYKLAREQKIMAKIFYDTECMKDLFIASFMDESGEFTDFVFHKDINANMRRHLTAFWEMHKKSSTLVSFNGLGYDNRLLAELVNRKCKTLSELRDFSDKIIADENNDDGPTKRELTDDFADIFLILKKNKIDFPGLKAIACSLNFPNLKECPVSFNQVETTPEEAEQILEYCHNDVRLTKQIFESDDVQGKYMARLGLAHRFGFTLKEALTKTPSSAAGLAITRMCLKNKKEGDTLPAPILKFKMGDLLSDKLQFKTEECSSLLASVKEWERDFMKDTQLSPNIVIRMGANDISVGVGGIHTKKSGDNSNFIFFGDKEKIVDADVDSYYPNILINLAIAPTGIESEFRGAVAEVLRMKREATNKAERQAAKLIINSLTGYLKNQHAGVLYSPRTNEAMTMNGQLMLLELCEALHLAGFHIVQVNTDGVATLVPDERREEYNTIASAWSVKWNFDLKYAEYTHLIQAGVNEYLAKKSDGSFKTTGGFFNLYAGGNGVDRYPIVTKCVIDHILYGTPMKDTVRGGTPYDYCRSVKRGGKHGGWKLEGEAKGAFHDRGVNRFYLTNASNILSGISNTESRRESKEEVGVAFANDIADFDKDSIAYERYIVLAEEAFSEFGGHEMTGYSDALYLPRLDTTDKDLIPIEGGSILRPMLIEAGLLTKRGKTLRHCVDPDCNPRNGSSRCELYDEGTTSEHTFCHQCRTYLDATLLAEHTGADKPKQPSLLMPPVATPKAPDTTDLPECVWSGSIGAIADAMRERSWRVLAGALAARHALIGRKINADYFAGTKIYGNMFVLFTGASGTGKSVAMNTAQKALGKEFNAITSIASGEALFQAISESHEEVVGQKVNEKGKTENILKTVYTAVPTIFCFEEFMATLKRAKADFSTIDQELCTLFQASPVYKMCSRAIAKEDGVPTRSLENPDVSLLATMTTKQFVDYFKETQQTNGLLNRILVLPETPFERRIEETGERPDWYALAHAFDDLRGRSALVDGFVAKRTYFTPEAWAIYERAFNEWFVNDNPMRDELTPYARYQLLWYIVALGYAYDAGRYDCIGETDACAASAVIGASREALARLLEMSANEIELPSYMVANGRVDDSMERYVQENPGKTKRELRRAKNTKKIPGQAWEDSLDRLAKSKRVVTRINQEDARRIEYFIAT